MPCLNGTRKMLAPCASPLSGSLHSVTTQSTTNEVREKSFTIPGYRITRCMWVKFHRKRITEEEGVFMELIICSRILGASMPCELNVLPMLAIALVGFKRQCLIIDYISENTNSTGSKIVRP